MRRSSLAALRASSASSRLSFAAIRSEDATLLAASHRSNSDLALSNRFEMFFTSASALSRSALHSLTRDSDSEPENSAILSVSC